MRAERRHHRERLKKSRRLHWGRDLAGDKRQHAQVVDTPTPCSCFMCGNPRRYFDVKSMQERRAEELERKGLDEQA